MNTGTQAGKGNGIRVRIEDAQAILDGCLEIACGVIGEIPTDNSENAVVKAGAVGEIEGMVSGVIERSRRLKNQLTRLFDSL